MVVDMFEMTSERIEKVREILATGKKSVVRVRGF